MSIVQKFIIATLAFVIIYLVVIKNPKPFKQMIQTVTDIFGQGFRAVTSVGNFK